MGEEDVSYEGVGGLVREKVFGIAYVVEEGGEGYDFKVEGRRRRGVGVDVLGETDDALDVREVVTGVVGGHVGAEVGGYREDEGVSFDV